MPSGPYLTATVLVNACIPAFAMLYASLPIIVFAFTVPIFIMHPFLRLIMPGSDARIVKKLPVKVTASERFHTSREVESKSCGS